MIKYRQLHLDSNHGFLRLDDDPVVQPKKESPKPTNVPTPSRQSLPRKSNVTKDNSSKNKPKITYPNRPRTEIRCLNDASPLEAPGSSRDGAVAGASGAREVQKAPPKRTNDQPQINTTVANLDKVHKDLPMSRGAIKKRMAPMPPPPVPVRHLVCCSPLQRHQLEQHQRMLQSAHYAAIGLRPVFTPTVFLNRHVYYQDYMNRMHGHAWPGSRMIVPTGYQHGSNRSEHTPARELWPQRRSRSSEHAPPRELRPQPRSRNSEHAPPGELWPQPGPSNSEHAPGGDLWPEPGSSSSEHASAEDSCPQPDTTTPELDPRIDLWTNFSDLKPMSPQEFADRFKHLHLGRESDDETRWVMGSARSGAGAAGNSAEATSSAWTAGNGARSQGSDMRTTRGGATTAGSSARAADNSAGAAGSNAGAASSSAEAAESNAGPADSRVEVMSSNAGAGDSSAGASGSIARSPGSDARSPRSDARSPGSDARSPGSDARSPGSSIWAPGSDARSPGSGARSPGSDARSPGNSIWAWDGPGAAGTGAGATEARAGGSDRFSEIKSSLQELRRGLNEVTAPYNSNISPSDNNINVRPSPRRVNRDPRGSQGFQGHQGLQGHQGTRAPWGSQASDAPQAATQVPLTAQAIAAHDGCEVNAQLPCEFCNVLVPANHLVLHQTGCRPDLTQLRPDLMQLQPRGRGFRRAAPSFYDTLHEEPVIPCEFCTESLPLYLIIEHQERCRRESDQQFPD
ncbi:uncharacterized protein LOC113515151 isoform X2 [Galleria mellonella]|nr:uncharacterized protein LOC113515151 isoform X2 [Galleria mellonella]